MNTLIEQTIRFLSNSEPLFYCEYVTPKNSIEVSEVLEVHEVPSEEVRMVPNSPTATKVLFP